MRFLSEDSYEGELTNTITLNRYAYCGGNPLKYYDPSGNWFDVALDAGFVTYDFHQIRKDPTNIEYYVALVFDTAGALLPLIPAATPLARSLDNAIIWSKTKVNSAWGGIKKFFSKSADNVISSIDNVARSASDNVIKGTGETVAKYWDNVVEFSGNKVYQRSDLFAPDAISSWKVKGKTVTGTNVERMASGRAPIGYDGKAVNLHHLTQIQTGAIVEVSQSFHQSNYSTIHINTGQLPSGINRADFNKWRGEYWINRAKDFLD